MKLAIYDFDGTLYPKETVPSLFNYYLRNGYSKRSFIRAYTKMMILFAKYKTKLDPALTKELFRGQATAITLELFDHMNEKEINNFFERLGKHIFSHLDQAIIQTLKEHQENNYKTMLISGGFSPLIHHIGKQLNFDYIEATEIPYTMTQRGNIIAKNEPLHIVAGTNKVKVLKDRFLEQTVDWSSSYAYADSVYDKDLLHCVGYPVGVNPDDGLKKICVEHRWEILETTSGLHQKKKVMTSK